MVGGPGSPWGVGPGEGRWAGREGRSYKGERERRRARTRWEPSRDSSMTYTSWLAGDASSSPRPPLAPLWPRVKEAKALDGAGRSEAGREGCWGTAPICAGKGNRGERKGEEGRPGRERGAERSPAHPIGEWCALNQTLVFCASSEPVCVRAQGGSG